MQREKSYEELLVDRFLALCGPETALLASCSVPHRDFGLLLVQGFEERSLGAVRKLSGGRYRAKQVAILRYANEQDSNSRYARALAAEIANVTETPAKYFDMISMREAVASAFAYLDCVFILVDITSMANGLIFAALDAAKATRRRVGFVYTDAITYAPSLMQWRKAKQGMDEDSTIPEIMEQQEWISNSNYSVSLVDGHEGYDGISSTKALVAYLPFKAARLSAIVNNEDYAGLTLIAVRPRFKENLWRLEALKEVNERVIRNHEVRESLAFGFSDAARLLCEVLYVRPGLLQKHDVHVAILGSKLQTVGTWIVSAVTASITIVSCRPERYFAGAYSEGIGESWFIDLPLEVIE